MPTIPLRLDHLFNNWFDRNPPKHRYIMEKVESPTSIYVGIMRYNGLSIDRPLIGQNQMESEKKLVELTGRIAFIIGDVPIGANTTSTAAFKRYLFDTLGLPKMKLTAKEKDSLDDEAHDRMGRACA